MSDEPSIAELARRARITWSPTVPSEGEPIQWVELRPSPRDFPGYDIVVPYGPVPTREPSR